MSHLSYKYKQCKAVTTHYTKYSFCPNETNAEKMESFCKYENIFTDVFICLYTKKQKFG